MGKIHKLWGEGRKYANALNGKQLLFPVNLYNLGRQHPVEAISCDSG